MQPDHPSAASPRDRLRRYGPISAVMLVIAALVGASFVGGDDGGDGTEVGSSSARQREIAAHTASGERSGGTTTAPPFDNV